MGDGCKVDCTVHPSGFWSESADAAQESEDRTRLRPVVARACRVHYAPCSAPLQLSVTMSTNGSGSGWRLARCVRVWGLVEIDLAGRVPVIKACQRAARYICSI